MTRRTRNRVEKLEARLAPGGQNKLHLIYERVWAALSSEDLILVQEKRELEKAGRQAEITVDHTAAYQRYDEAEIQAWQSLPRGQKISLAELDAAMASDD